MLMPNFRAASRLLKRSGASVVGIIESLISREPADTLAMLTISFLAGLPVAGSPLFISRKSSCRALFPPPRLRLAGRDRPGRQKFLDGFG
jgi:hypothetical protein